MQKFVGRLISKLTRVHNTAISSDVAFVVSFTSKKTFKFVRSRSKTDKQIDYKKTMREEREREIWRERRKRRDIVQ